MALRVCLDCQTAYAADLEACPQCGYAKYRWDYEEPAPAKPAGKTPRKET